MLLLGIPGFGPPPLLGAGRLAKTPALPLSLPAPMRPTPVRPPGPGSHIHVSPHVDAGGLSGGSQKQFGGSVPANTSTPPRILQ